MKLYAFLCTHLPIPLANAITGLWFAALVFIALFFGAQPEADFRYTDF